MLRRQPSSEVKLSTYCPVTVGRSLPVQRTDQGDLKRNGSGAWFPGSKLIHSSFLTFGDTFQLDIIKILSFSAHLGN